MQTVGYYNGEVGEIAELRVPMLDRGCYFGDGVYDAALMKRGAMFAADDHIARFYNSARLLDMTPEMAPDELTALFADLAAHMDAQEVFLYWQLTRGTAPRGHAGKPGMKTNLWAMLTPFTFQDVYAPMRLVTTEDVRYSLCHIKTLNLIPNVMAARKASDAGCDECVFVRDGVVTECAHSNLHILKDGVLRTHPTDCRILPGVSRKHLVALCGRLGVPVDERPFTVGELFGADEVLVSGTTVLARPVSEIDGTAVGGKAPALLGTLLDGMRAEWVNF